LASNNLSTVVLNGTSAKSTIVLIFTSQVYTFTP